MIIAIVVLITSALIQWMRVRDNSSPLRAWIASCYTDLTLWLSNRFKTTLNHLLTSRFQVDDLVIWYFPKFHSANTALQTLSTINTLWIDWIWLQWWSDLSILSWSNIRSSRWCEIKCIKFHNEETIFLFENEDFIWKQVFSEYRNSIFIGQLIKH